MIIDSRNEFADSATLVGTAAAAIASNVIDLGATPTLRDLGGGKPVYLVIQIDASVAASGGAANVTFKLVSDSTTNLATSPTTHFSTGAIAKGTLVAGFTVATVALPSGKTYERYLGITATPDTNDTTAGSYSAFLTETPELYTSYDDALS